MAHTAPAPAIDTALFARNNGVTRDSSGTLHLLIKKTTDMGHGVFAKVDILQGTTMLIEEPTLILSAPRDQKNKLVLDVKEVNHEISKLSANSRRQIQRLTSIIEDPERASNKDRVEVNCHDVAQRNGTSQCGVSLFYSRINHSCAPNAEHVWRPEVGTGRMVLQAIADIQDGEQITINYLGNDWASYHERKKKLEEDYGFQCYSCRLCWEDWEGQPTRRFQERRSRMKTFENDFHPVAVPALHAGALTGSHATFVKGCNAEVAGEFFLLIELELNDFRAPPPGHRRPQPHTVDSRLSKCADTAAVNFRDRAEYYAAKGDGYFAALGCTWEAIFLSYAIIIGDICYGRHFGACGTQTHISVAHQVAKLENCIGQRHELEYRDHKGDVLWCFEKTAAGQEMKRKFEELINGRPKCLRPESVVALVQRLLRNVRHHNGPDDDDSDHNGEQDGGDAMEIDTEGKARSLNNIPDDVEAMEKTPYGFPQPEVEQTSEAEAATEDTSQNDKTSQKKRSQQGGRGKTRERKLKQEDDDEWEPRKRKKRTQ